MCPTIAGATAHARCCTHTQLHTLQTFKWPVEPFVPCSCGAEQTPSRCPALGSSQVLLCRSVTHAVACSVPLAGSWKIHSSASRALVVALHQS